MDNGYTGYADIAAPRPLNIAVGGTGVTLLAEYGTLQAACSSGNSCCLIDRRFLRAEYTWETGDMNRTHDCRIYRVYLAERQGFRFIVIWINSLGYAGPHEGYPWRHVSRVMSYEGPEPDMEACRRICAEVEPAMAEYESPGYQLNGLDADDSCDRGRMIELMYRLGLISASHSICVSYEQLLTLRVKVAFGDPASWTALAAKSRTPATIFDPHDSIQLMKLTFPDAASAGIARLFGSDVVITPVGDGRSAAAVLALRSGLLGGIADALGSGIKAEYAE